MPKSELFCLLPEDFCCTPDGMETDREGNLILSCPNYADLSMPSCILKIDKNRRVRKWFDVPKNPATGEARSMGIAFGPDGDLYIIDNPGWTERPELVFTGRVLRVRMNGDEIEKVTVVADGMEHPNGIRIRGNYMYLTQSYLRREKTPDGKLMSCVYAFRLDDHDIHCTNTLADKNIIATFITQNPDCQYGVDGIVFDREGRLVIGNFGDGSLYRLTLSEDGSKVLKNEFWCADPKNLKTTDGMVCDPATGNIYIADFSANAIGKVTPEGKISRYAVSPDCTGFDGGLDEPGEPIIWQGKLVVSCFDLVVDEQKVNTAHEMPATMALLDIE